MARAKKAPSPFADGRGSAVNPDVDKAAAGEGGTVESEYSGKPNIPASDRVARKMDKGLPLRKR
jgi:hypothetical protein